MNRNDENGNGIDIGLGGIATAAASPGASAGASPATSPRAESIRTGGTNASVVMQRVPLGAELPLFCERCGYSLNALPQVRCDHCTVLQFHCPECGHHQPINTLRPALQRTLGRMRSWVVGVIAFFKLNWFGWHLFFWVIMGHEWAFTYDWRSQNQGSLMPTFEAILAFSIYGGVIGFFSRLLLLRWRSGVLVGVVLGALICMALVLGFHWRISDNRFYGNNTGDGHVLVTTGRAIMAGITFAVIVATAAIAWPIWVGFVRVVMPERAGSALLEWQRSLSDPLERARLSDKP